jgi:hypothetical protein
MIRIYAPDIGNGSLAIVARGIRSVLEELGVFAGLMPIDSAAMDGELQDGVEAPIALVVGNPNWVGFPLAYGRHKKIIVEYAPNTRKQPMSMLKTMLAAKVAMIITPSEWCRRVLIESWGEQIPVEVVRHGIDSRFRVVHSAAPENRFVILHHAASSPERKGTLELIQAVTEWGRDDVELDISCSIPTAMQISNSMDFRQSTTCRLLLPVPPLLPVPGAHTGATQRIANTWPESAIEQYRHCHVVCQPSRSEGFGMVPLEARACGVPVVMTCTTGHGEHVWTTSKYAGWGEQILEVGIVDIPVREDAPLICEMGAMAPRVDPDLILASLKEARGRFDTLKREVLDSARAVGEKWTWKAQVAPWAKRICEDIA